MDLRSGDAQRGQAQLGRLFSRGAIYTLGMLLSRLLAFAMVPVYTRVLTPDDYGVLELLETVDHVVTVIFSMAVTGSVLRFFHDADGARGRDQVVATALVCLVAAGTLVALAGWFAAPSLAPVLLREGSRTLLLRLTFVSVALQAVVEVPFAMLRGSDRPVVFVACSLLRLVLGLTLNLLCVVALRMGVLGMVVSNVLATLVMAAAMASLTLRRTGLTFSWGVVERMVRFGWPMVPGALSMIALNHSRAYVLNAYCPLADVGVWALGARIGMSVSLVIGYPFGHAWSTQMYELWKAPGGRDTYRRVGTALLFVLLWGAVALTTLAREVLALMATPAFERARVAIPAVAFAYVLRELGEYFRNGLLVAGDARPIAWIEPLLALVDVGIGVVLIGRFGIVGAAVGAPLVFLLYALLLHGAVRRALPVRYEYGRMALCGVVALGYTVLGLTVDTGSTARDVALKVLLLATFPVTGALVVFRDPVERALVRAALRRVGVVRVLEPGE